MTWEGGTAKPRVAAFFDVDNTIIRGASAFHLARGLRARGYFTISDLFRFAWEQFKYNVLGESKNQIDNLQGKALSIVKGWSVAEMAAIAEEIYDEVLIHRIYPGTKALIDEHISNGHEVWLVTASPIEIGRLIARRVGATGALGTVAAHKQGFYTGELIGGMMHGQAKAAGVEKLAAERDLDLDASYAYGDSMNDVFMLRIVGNPHAINPDFRLRREAKKAGWKVLDFRNRNRKGRRSVVRRSLSGFVWVMMSVLRAFKHTLCAPFRGRR